MLAGSNVSRRWHTVVVGVSARCVKVRRTSKMSMDGWWMVHTTVRPVSTVLRTVRMTMAAARASRPVSRQGT